MCVRVCMYVHVCVGNMGRVMQVVHALLGIMYEKQVLIPPETIPTSWRKSAGSGSGSGSAAARTGGERRGESAAAAGHTSTPAATASTGKAAPVAAPTAVPKPPAAIQRGCSNADRSLSTPVDEVTASDRKPSDDITAGNSLPEGTILCNNAQNNSLTKAKSLLKDIFSNYHAAKPDLDDDEERNKRVQQMLSKKISPHPRFRPHQTSNDYKPFDGNGANGRSFNSFLKNYKQEKSIFQRAVELGYFSSGNLLEDAKAQQRLIEYLTLIVSEWRKRSVYLRNIRLRVRKCTSKMETNCMERMLERWARVCSRTAHRSFTWNTLRQRRLRSTNVKVDLEVEDA